MCKISLIVARCVFAVIRYENVAVEVLRAEGHKAVPALQHNARKTYKLVPRNSSLVEGSYHLSRSGGSSFSSLSQSGYYQFGM
jgi:hypothetical protein